MVSGNAVSGATHTLGDLIDDIFGTDDNTPGGGNNSGLKNRVSELENKV
jgi:hypothetical protein